MVMGTVVWLVVQDKRDVKRDIMRRQIPRYCIICGKPAAGNGNTCRSCAEFIKNRKQEEKTHARNRNHNKKPAR